VEPIIIVNRVTTVHVSSLYVRENRLIRIVHNCMAQNLILKLALTLSEGSSRSSQKTEISSSVITASL
jgi:hypothetical protein